MTREQTTLRIDARDLGRAQELAERIGDTLPLADYAKDSGRSARSAVLRMAMKIGLDALEKQYPKKRRR